MDIMKDVKFWEANLTFLNKIGAEAGQKQQKYELNDENKNSYLEFMKKEGFDSENDHKIEAEFYVMLEKGIEKSKTRTKDMIRKFN